MARKKNQEEEQQPTKKLRRMLTSQARENRMIDLAMDMAEEQLVNRTASSQVLTHYLRLGSEKERTEQRKLELEVELVRAKTEALEATKRSSEMYENAISAMKQYSGNCDDEYYDEDDYYDDY